tara:strand:- start:30 stop:281 length:252 start_codon:yes stop_codon:yes gene_type:complete
MENNHLYTHSNVCQSCGTYIGHLWLSFEEELLKHIGDQKNNYDLPMRTGKEDMNMMTKQGEILNKLGLFKICCRISLITFPKH